MMGAARGKLIDGKAIAEAIMTEVTNDVAEFRKAHRAPALAVILVGENPASISYVKGKVAASDRCGIESTLIELPVSTTQQSLLDRIDRLNGDGGIDAILVQLPLPAQIDPEVVIERISPAKDVDGLHPYNLGRLVADKPRFIPCTPLGICELLARSGVETAGKRATIVGRSILVGKPMALLLARKGARGNATVTMCHSRSAELASVTRQAEILIVAIGSAGAVTGDMIREGAVVIDVGTNRVSDPSSKKGYRLTGDVDFASAVEKASLITPVPGGVGPMTVTMLMRNTLQAAKWAFGVGDEG